MNDYMDQLVLAEVQAITSNLPTSVNLACPSILFSTLRYFPLNNTYNECVDDGLYNIADSCITAKIPKTFQTSSFIRRYVTLLENTWVEPNSAFEGNNEALASAAARLSHCLSAARTPTTVNGGICKFPQNNSQVNSQFVPNYQIQWVPEHELLKTSFEIAIDIWRPNNKHPWRPVSESQSQSQGERITGTISYSQIKIVTISPLVYEPSSKQGWYDYGLIEAIRQGGAGELKYCPISENIFSSVELRRARLFVLAGNAKLSIKQSGTSFTPNVSMQKPSAYSRTMKSNEPTENVIHLTPHLKIPRAKLLPPTNLACSDKSTGNYITSNVWDSGDLFKDINAGLILAIIEDSPLTK